MSLEKIHGTVDRIIADAEKLPIWLRDLAVEQSSAELLTAIGLVADAERVMWRAKKECESIVIDYGRSRGGFGK